MFRTLLTTTAIVAATSFPVLADTTENVDAVLNQTRDYITSVTDTLTQGDAVPMLSSTVIGTSVYSQSAGADADAIAKISDLVLMTDGTVDGVILSVGGVLNMGDTDVRVGWDELGMERREAGDPRITVAMTREQLEVMEPFVPFREDGEETDNSMIETENEMIEQRADFAPTVAPTVVGEPSSAFTGSNMRVPLDAVNSSTLLGARIYGANDDHLGEIGNVVMSPEGEIDALIVDFGGFLGIGDKPVAIQYDTVKLMRDLSSDRIAVFTGLTDSELDAAAAFDEQSYRDADMVALDAS